MIDFMISDKGKELIKNEDEFKVKLADCFGELPNAVIVDELYEAAKYYTNNGESNVARYSFRFKDFCFPTLLFNYFSYAFRSMWLQAGVLFAVFFISSIFIGYKIKESMFLEYISNYLIISVVAAATYRYFLLKDFFTKYELTPVAGLRARKILNVLITIGVIVVVSIVVKLIFAFAISSIIGSAMYSVRYWYLRIIFN